MNAPSRLQDPSRLHDQSRFIAASVETDPARRQAARIRALEAEVAQLRRDLRLRADFDQVTRLGRALGLTASEAVVVLALNEGPGRVLPWHDLRDALQRFDCAFQPGEMAVRAHLSNVRRKLEPWLLGAPSIEARVRLGYRLTPDARLLVAIALSEDGPR